jgi:hydroxymethylbilane synthase
LKRLGRESEIRIITTTGDRTLNGPLTPVGGKGAFLKEIEEALLARDVDLAVHSLKDVPTQLPEGLELCALLKRDDPRDALLSGSGAPLARLGQGARVGTTSLRRRAQLLARRPDLQIGDLRGNVDTRIASLHEGKFDAIVLAMAGLRRLGRLSEVSEPLEPSVMLPAPGQGAIAIECRAGDTAMIEATSPLRDPPTAVAVAVEREFLAVVGGGCNAPLAAYAEPVGQRLRLRAFVGRPDGSVSLHGAREGKPGEPLGRQLAEELLARGAGELIPE